MNPPGDDPDATRLARIEELIKRYRKEHRRQLLQRALKLWRQSEAQRRRTTPERPPERVH